MALERPTVPGLILTAEEIRAAMVADLAGGGWAVSESSANPAWRVLGAAALELARVRRSIHDAMAQTSLAFAMDGALDLIGETYRDTPRKAGESNDDYRARLRTAVGFRAVGLSGAWYESVALEVEHVRFARAWSPSPGRVELGVLADPEAGDVFLGLILYPDGVPDADLRAAVLAAVTAPAVRQQTDDVVVVETSRLRYDVELDVQVQPHEGSQLVLAGVRTQLEAVLAAVDVLGGIIPHHAVTSAAIGRGAIARLFEVDGAGARTPVEVVWGGDAVAPLHRTLTLAVASAPGAPVAPMAAHGSAPGVIAVTWAPPAALGGGIESYAVGVSADNVAWTVTAAVASPAAITAGVELGVRYRARVRALSLAGVAGAWSDASTLADVPPAPPARPMLAPMAGGQLMVTWVAPEERGDGSDDATGLRYNVRHRPRDSEDVWVQVGPVAGLETTLQGLPAGDRDVQVQAQNGVGAGAWSRTATARVMS